MTVDDAPGKEPASVPPGRYETLPSGERLFVRECGAPDAPPLILLHGWVGTGGTNFHLAFPMLAPYFRVLAPDHRGHGRGIRTPGRFALEDCAADVAGLIDALELDDVIIAGFSMGGPIAQLSWRARRERVAGLVLGATSYRFVTSSVLRMAVTSTVPAIARATYVTSVADHLPLGRVRALLPGGTGGDPSMAGWGGGEMRRHDVRLVVEAGMAVSAYDATDWIGEIDVPTAIVLTAKDRAVAPAAQLRLAHAIKGATVHPVADGHLGGMRPEFCRTLESACLDVAGRAGVLPLDITTAERAAPVVPYTRPAWSRAR